MKFVPPKTTEDKIQENINEAKQQLRRKQHPTKNAPKISEEKVIFLSGCAFAVHSQDSNKLVLKTDDKINFEKDVNVLRSLSYIMAVYEVVSIDGWDWRPVKTKKNKLTLKPVSPTII